LWRRATDDGRELIFNGCENHEQFRVLMRTIPNRCRKRDQFDHFDNSFLLPEKNLHDFFVLVSAFAGRKDVLYDFLRKISKTKCFRLWDAPSP
jgi:hypothetical protein